MHYLLGSKSSTSYFLYVIPAWDRVCLFRAAACLPGWHTLFPYSVWHLLLHGKLPHDPCEMETSPAASLVLPVLKLTGSLFLSHKINSKLSWKGGSSFCLQVHLSVSCLTPNAAFGRPAPRHCLLPLAFLGLLPLPGMPFPSPSCGYVMLICDSPAKAFSSS